MPKRSTAWAISLVLLLLLSSLALVASPLAAQGSEDQQTASQPATDEPTPGTTWSLDVYQTSSGDTVFDNVGQDGRVTERLLTTFKPETATLEHSYHWDQGDEEDRPFPDRDTTASSNATVQVSAVYVFRDIDGDGAYQLGDEIISYNRLSQASVRSEALDLPDPLRGVAATYELDDGSAFTVNLYTTDERRWFGNRLVDPSELEFNLTLEGVDASQPDTHVGVQLSVEGTGELQAASDEAFEYINPGAKTKLRWAELARVEEGYGPVGATVLERKMATDAQGPGAGWVVLSAPAGERVDLGVTLVSYDVSPSALEAVVQNVLGNLPVYLAGLAGTAALVGLSVYLQVREDGSTGRRGRGPSQEA